MKTLFWILPLTLLMGGCRSARDGAASAPAAPSAIARSASSAPSASLYSRLGGYDAVAAVTDEFLARLMSDKQTGRFFLGFGKDAKGTIRQHIVEFLCSIAGGPCNYTGRDMGPVHEQMGITEKDWNIAVSHLVAALDKFKVPAREKNEVLQAVSSFKDEIVDAR